MNRLNKTESAVFLYRRFFLFLKDPFFQIIYLKLKRQQLSCFLVSNLVARSYLSYLTLLIKRPNILLFPDLQLVYKRFTMLIHRH